MLWKQLVEASRTSLERVYDRLDIRFDEWLGESAYHEALPGVVELLLQKGFAREDDGAICVFWGELADKYGDAIPKDLARQKQPFIIRKRDGAFLYSTSDIATVQYRKSHFKADRSVYVVDGRQSLHFKQLFVLAELLEIDIALQHVGFGVVMRGGKPLKTRDTSGQVITLASLLDEAIRRALARMGEEGIDVPEEELAEVARVVGIGAIKYADLSQNRSSDYEFDWDKMISFKGNAGPYLQYAYARTRAIFRKGEIDADSIAGPVIIGEPAETGPRLAFAALFRRPAQRREDPSSPPHRGPPLRLGTGVQQFLRGVSRAQGRGRGTSLASRSRGPHLPSAPSRTWAARHRDRRADVRGLRRLRSVARDAVVDFEGPGVDAAE